MSAGSVLIALTIVRHVSGSNYGVSIDPAGRFSGYTWSSSVGWISFNEINPPDNYAFNDNCKTGNSCNAAHNCTACYNSTDSGKVYGWAKILTLGNNGWIKLMAPGLRECQSIR